MIPRPYGIEKLVYPTPDFPPFEQQLMLYLLLQAKTKICLTNAKGPMARGGKIRGEIKFHME